VGKQTVGYTHILGLKETAWGTILDTSKHVFYVKKGKLTVYIGDTAHSVYLKGLQHRKGLETDREDSAMWKHSQIEHESIKTDFRMEITEKLKDPPSKTRK
jgi:hypothetical protein